MNLYVTVPAVKTMLSISSSTHDDLLDGFLGFASRRCDDVSDRHFFTTSGTRYFGATQTIEQPIDDVLSISTFGVDTEADETFDGESWVEGTDYVLTPRNTWPKTAVRLKLGSSKLFAKQNPYMMIAGVWGYGNGLSDDPWTAAGITGTVEDATGTSLTLSAADILERGHTLKIGAEQMFVSAVSDTTATVSRGVNGTTASAHDTVAISLAQYPARLEQVVRILVGEAWTFRKTQGHQMVMAGNYQAMFRQAIKDVDVARQLGNLRRGSI